MLLTSVCLTRFGLKRFEKKVNELLGKGLVLVDLRVERLGFFRLYCIAMFEDSGVTLEDSD